MAKDFAADRVLFTRILNWGTYTTEEFNSRSMVDQEGNPLPELAEILRQPICSDPIVDIGTFGGEHVYDDTRKIGNYYLWEIDNFSGLNLEKLLIG